MVVRVLLGCALLGTFPLSMTSEALLGVLGIRDNWQNNFRDKRKLTKKL